jgi:hypothetical protein
MTKSPFFKAFPIISDAFKSGVKSGFLKWSMGVGTVTIKVESICNNYNILVQNITFTVLKISQPLLNLDYDMLPLTYKKSLDKLELKLANTEMNEI